MTSVAVEHEDTTARWITFLLTVQRRERSHELERWSKEMKAAIRWDTVALRALQQGRNQRLIRWSEEVRSRVDGAVYS